jgi:hypothetical protein
MVISANFKSFGCLGVKHISNFTVVTSFVVVLSCKMVAFTTSRRRELRFHGTLRPTSADDRHGYSPTNRDRLLESCLT